MKVLVRRQSRRQYAGVTAAALSMILTGVVFAPASSAADYSTTNIGSQKWWDANIPYRAPKSKRVNGQLIRSCPNGFGPEIAGAEQQRTSDGVRIVYDSRTAPKNVSLLWVNGRMKKVRGGTTVCRAIVKPLRPASVAELSTWTFASPKDRVGFVPVYRPPLDTCIPAQLPSRVQPQLLSAIFVGEGQPLVYEYPDGIVNTTSVRGNSTAGVYNIRWILTGGQGTYRYPTWAPNADGVLAESWKATSLNPGEMTTVEVTLPLMPTPTGGLQTSGSSLGGIAPMCGEQYLPEGQTFWTDGSPTGSLSIDGNLGVTGTRSDPELYVFASNVPTD